MSIERSKMKLLFLIDNRKFVRGGAYSIYKFAEYLARRGHNVFILSNIPPSFLRDKKLPAIFKIKISPHINYQFKGSGKINRLIEDIYYRILGNRVLGYYQPDFIIGHQLLSGIRASQLGKRHQVPIVVFTFESPKWLAFTYWKQINSDRNRTRYLDDWSKFQEAMNNSKVVFVNSIMTLKKTREDLNKFVNIQVIYPGLPEILINDGKRKNQIIYIGALIKSKNVNEVIEALSLTKEPLKLLICGEGYEKHNLALLAQRRCLNYEFKGVITDTEKWKLISESKFMVFPSSFEGFGMPPMEALACGIPCICSDLPIFGEVYEDKVEYFEEHNVNQLAEKMQYLLDHPDYCQRRGEEGRKYVTQKFSWEKSAKKIETILSENLNKNKQQK